MMSFDMRPSAWRAGYQIAGDGSRLRTMSPAPVAPGRSHARALIYAALIALVWMALYLPNLGTPVFSGMEGLRYSIARETSQHGDWLQLYFNGAPYYNKPPLVTWMMLPAIKGLDSIDEFALRLPFAVSMLGMALGIFAFAARWLSWERAAIVALLPLTSVGALRFGRACEIDGVFAVFFVLAVAAWSDSWLRPRQHDGIGRTLLLGVALGLGGLCKGPLILGLFGIFCALVLLHGREWRRVPVAALVLGAALPLVWVMVLYARGIGHEALGVWGQQVGMRFAHGGTPSPLVPPHQIQIVWGLSLTLPWSLIYPLLYYPGFLPKNLRLGALLRGGRDAGMLCLLGILAWPGLQYQYIAPVSLLIALEVGVVAVTVRPLWRRGLGRGLQIVTGALAVLLATISVTSFLFSDSLLGISVAALGLLGCFALLRAGGGSDDASREIKYALSAMVAAAAVAVFCIVPPLSIGDNFREVGLQVKQLVPEGEQVYCPLSIDNLAAYTGRHVVINAPNDARPVVYAILRDDDVTALRQSPKIGVEELYRFDYKMGWKLDKATLHLVRLAAAGPATDWPGILAPVSGS